MHGNRRETPINVHALLISVSDPVAPCSYFLDILRQSVFITRTRRRLHNSIQHLPERYKVYTMSERPTMLFAAYCITMYIFVNKKKRDGMIKCHTHTLSVHALFHKVAHTIKLMHDSYNIVCSHVTCDCNMHNLSMTTIIFKEI